MSQLIVRKLSPRIVQQLKRRAAERGRSAEAEHRAILEAALGGPGADDDFTRFVLAMPSAPALRVRRSKDKGRRIIL